MAGSSFCRAIVLIVCSWGKTGLSLDKKLMLVCIGESKSGSEVDDMARTHDSLPGRK